MTQMTFGFSRDDVGTFLPVYLKNNLLEDDPFEGKLHIYSSLLYDDALAYVVYDAMYMLK